MCKHIFTNSLFCLWEKRTFDQDPIFSIWNPDPLSDKTLDTDPDLH